MGCSSNKEQRLNVEAIYTQKNLPLPDQNLYENSFEKEAFMTINLFRHEPKLFIPLIREVKSKWLRLRLRINQFWFIDNKLYKGKNWAKLIKEIEKIEGPFALLKIDQEAFQACRQNNDAAVADESQMPKQGGNLDKLRMIVGDQRMPSAEEFTMVQWDGTAHELIVFNLLEEYEKTGKPSLMD